MLFVESALKDSGLFETFKAGGEGVGAQAWHGLLEILEAAGAVAEQIAEDEEGPAFADDAKRSGDGAF